MGARFVWLSYPLNEGTPAYGGGKGLVIKSVRSIAKGDSSNTSVWHLPSHLGTHVDVPKHFFQAGNSVDVYDAAFWIFKQVSIVGVKPEVKPLLIEPEYVIPFVCGEPDIILIKTGIGQYREREIYWEANPGLSPDLGTELRARFSSLRAVGIDFISISSWQDRSAGKEAHRAFLDPATPGKPIILIEDMDLSALNSNTQVQKIVALPLRVENGDGAPCSVIAEVVHDD
jgi:kynurenine formamidase